MEALLVAEEFLRSNPLHLTHDAKEKKKQIVKNEGPDPWTWSMNETRSYKLQGFQKLGN